MKKEPHRCFFDQEPSEFTTHPVFLHDVPVDRHVLIHDLIKPPRTLTQALGRIVLQNLSNVPSEAYNEPIERIMGLEDTIRLLDSLAPYNEEADDLARNLTAQYRLIVP